MSNNTSMTDLMNAKIQSHVEAIEFYIKEGIDRAKAISMVRKGSCLSGAVWTTIEARVQVA